MPFQISHSGIYSSLILTHGIILVHRSLLQLSYISLIFLNLLYSATLLRNLCSIFLNARTSMQIHNALSHNLIANHFIEFQSDMFLSIIIKKSVYSDFHPLISIRIQNYPGELYSICPMRSNLALLFYPILRESFNQIYLQ
jgi:hypothetical protein